MEMSNLGAIVFVVVFVAIFATVLRSVARESRRAKEYAANVSARSEAMFQSMFPELQPHFHPKNVIAFVFARRGHQPKAGRVRTKAPPGFPGADSAEIDFTDGKERVTLLDAAGATLASFLYEENADGGVMRIGKGKMTVTLPTDGGNRVRYWHPDREFKWKRNQWTFQSRMADREIESGESSSFASDSSSSSSGIARSAAAAGGIVAAGGSFDGGGASASWDGASAGSSSEGSGGGSAFEGGSASATAY